MLFYTELEGLMTWKRDCVTHDDGSGNYTILFVDLYTNNSILMEISRAC